MKTILGTEVPENARGIVYLCHFHNSEESFTLEVFKEIFFTSIFRAFDAYANIPNPASQLAYGKTFEELCISLEILHNNMVDPTWLKNLSEAI